MFLLGLCLGKCRMLSITLIYHHLFETASQHNIQKDRNAHENNDRNRPGNKIINASFFPFLVKQYKSGHCQQKHSEVKDKEECYLVPLAWNIWLAGISCFNTVHLLQLFGHARANTMKCRPCVLFWCCTFKRISALLRWVQFDGLGSEITCRRKFSLLEPFNLPVSDSLAFF